MTAAWWDEAPDLLKSAFRHPGGRTRTTRYRFGLGFLELDCDDVGLNQRFAQLYSEGEVAGEGPAGAPRVTCRVRSLDEPALAAIRFDDPESLDPVEFCRRLFPDRNHVAGPEGPEGWRTIALAGRASEPMIALKEAEALADRRQGWQPLVANLALNRLLRLQRELIFLHAGSACVGGRGLLLIGPKHSGKTTLSLALAARGHDFLGDEVAAVHLGDARLLPFRRAAAIRQGIRAERVERSLAGGDYPAETFPDGSARVLASVARLFPDSRAGEADLSHVFFLRGFAARPRATRFDFGREHFPLLTPLGSSLWCVPGGQRLLQVSRLMARVRCYHLEAGMPDETADLLESLCQEPSN